jgi:hypothetical protein
MSKLKVQIKPKAQMTKFKHLDFDIDLPFGPEETLRVEGNFGFWNLDFNG